MAQQGPPPRRGIAGAPEVGRVPSNIDRRKCHRVVPMEVMAFGLSRTGTASLRQALIDLGYDDCYHYAAIFFENPPDAEMWIDALEAKFKGVGKPFGKKEWDQLLGHCMAVTDTPCLFFWQELYKAYPDAKIILTVRDNADVWADSIEKSIKEPYVDQLFPKNGWYEHLLHFFYPIPFKMQRFTRDWIWLTPMWQSIMTGKETSKRFYEAHNDAIKKGVPASNLLVFNVKQGWGPLCKFLGKEVPPWDFPKSHERDTFISFNRQGVGHIRAVAEKRLMWSLALLVGGIAVAGSVAYYGPRSSHLLTGLRRLIRW